MSSSALSWILTTLTLLITVIFLGYKYFTRNFDYWKKRGVYNPEPLPFFGHFYDMAAFKYTLSGLIKKYYDMVDEPYFGMFAFDKPVLVIKSPELIKNILIKDFNSFCNRTMAEADHSKYITHFIFMQKNPKWKYTRGKLTSLFTSSMTKTFFSEIQEINKNFIKYLEKISGPVDAKFVTSHFTSEMIARCFFATDPRCFEEKISQFRHRVHQIFEYTIRNAVIQTCYFLRQNWVSFFKLEFTASSVMSFFENTFKDAMECRKNYNGKPINMVDIVNDLNRKQNGDHPDSELLIANSLFLLMAGQETTSSTLSFALYELALHPHIQERLRDEVKENCELFNGITFEGIQKNKYLEMVVNETLRKYGVLPFLDREALTDYRLEGADFVIEKGTMVYLPLFALMRDPKHFPNPDQFDPERFADNNINSDGLTFIPFGEGPRACIGKRLGTLAVASALSHILLKFRLEKTPKTPDPLEFEPKSFVLVSKTGLEIKFAPIS